jgi:predicted AAA+ superfamily ATPase
MTVFFISELEQKTSKRSITYLKKRMETLANEKKDSDIINKIIKEIFQPEIDKKSKVKLIYRTDSYNDAIKYIENSASINTFKKQYYFVDPASL